MVSGSPEFTRKSMGNYVSSPGARVCCKKQKQETISRYSAASGEVRMGRAVPVVPRPLQRGTPKTQPCPILNDMSRSR